VKADVTGQNVSLADSRVVLEVGEGHGEGEQEA